ncbi:MAG: type I-B CRISPR-associated protein Cas7/Csh2 [Thermoproteota archaeon]
MNMEKMNRKEIVFLYDAKLINPNGDPLDDNKPRMLDDGTEIVTDVRLKRTIRDFIERNREKDEFLKKRNAKVWLLDERTEEGEQKTKETQLEERADYENYTDIKLFGATILPKNEGKKESSKNVNVVLTGPVQFRFGISKNYVTPVFIKGTTVSPSGGGKKTGTFTERWVVDYALISFYGVVNENTAEQNAKEVPGEHKKVELKEEDLQVMYYAMWNGTKDLVSQSKVGQTPRLLLVINYKKGNFQIGNVDLYLKLAKRENIKSIEDCELMLDDFLRVLKENKEKIDSIYYKVDSALKLTKEGKPIEISKALEEIGIGAKEFDKEYGF